jgi:hypothetical protein
MNDNGTVCSHVYSDRSSFPNFTTAIYFAACKKLELSKKMNKCGRGPLATLTLTVISFTSNSPVGNEPPIEHVTFLKSLRVCSCVVNVYFAYLRFKGLTVQSGLLALISDSRDGGDHTATLHSSQALAGARKHLGNDGNLFLTTTTAKLRHSGLTTISAISAWEPRQKPEVQANCLNYNGMIRHGKIYDVV